jgi:hypothetical protein
MVVRLTFPVLEIPFSNVGDRNGGLNGVVLRLYAAWVQEMRLSRKKIHGFA